MAETAPTPKFSRVTITNSAPGARYVHTKDGVVTIPADSTSEPLEISEGELADIDAAEHFKVAKAGKGAAADTGDGGGSEKTKAPEGTPEDLTSDRSNDGFKGKDALITIAKNEGVTLEGDDDKPGIVAKIVAARAAKAQAAGQ